MTSKPPSSSAARRNSAQLTRTLNVTNYIEDTSERVPVWNSTSSSPHSIQGRLDVRNTPQVVETPRESGDAEVDARAYVPDDASGVSSVRDGGGKGASTVDDEWRVVIREDEDGGLVRLDLEHID